MRTLLPLAWVALLLAFILPIADDNRLFSYPSALGYAAMLTVTAAVSLRRRRELLWLHGVIAAMGTAVVLLLLNDMEQTQAGYWLLLLSVWLQTWFFSERLSRCGGYARPAQFIVPIFFGVALLMLWEAVTRGAGVSPVLLPPPSAIAARLTTETGVLFDDFRQTVLKAVLIGYFIGCASGAMVAILVDRVPFLRRGLLPMGNFIAALPIVGIAPIMVMWFGFDWQSKAAVVVVMTFFPMLVNTVAGLHDHSTIERDLMTTYAANYRQRLLKLNLPAAMPFVFNALKINSTLALIGAIVAEFFGTPIVGMGFRISTEVGRMNLDMVWAEITVAALTGTAFYGILSLLEQKVVFWHPSVRRANH